MMALLKDCEIEGCMNKSELELCSSACLTLMMSQSCISRTTKILILQWNKADVDN